MVHDGLAERSFVPTLQRREKAHAVFSGMVGQLRTEDVRARGEKVGQADELVRGGAGFDMAGPANNERNAMPAVKYVRLGSAEVVAWVVPLGVEFVELRLGRAAVVAGEDHQRASGQIMLIECSEELADRPVHLHHEIAIGIEAALALPFGRGSDWCVWRIKRQIEEEKLAGFGVGGSLTNIVHRL